MKICEEPGRNLICFQEISYRWVINDPTSSAAFSSEIVLLLLFNLAHNSLLYLQQFRDYFHPCKRLFNELLNLLVTKVFRIDFSEHATDVFFSSRFFFVVATEMLVVSCTVEDCDEMKKSIT